MSSLSQSVQQYASEIDALCQWGRSCVQRRWSHAGSGTYSLVLQHSPVQLLATVGTNCRSQLTTNDFGIVDSSVLNQASFASSSCKIHQRDLELHLWIADHGKAGAILQTTSVWSGLLAERFAPLDGVLLDQHDLLRTLASMDGGSESSSECGTHWLPIVAQHHDVAAQIAAIEQALTARPAEFDTKPSAVVIQQGNLLVWAKDLTQAIRRAEVLEYFCELLVRKAQFS